MLLVSFCHVTGVYTGVSPTAEAVLKQSSKSQLRARILPFITVYILPCYMMIGFHLGAFCMLIVWFLDKDRGILRSILTFC